MEKLKTTGATNQLLLALCVLPSALQAHRLDECLQAAMMVIEPARVHLQLTIEPGVEVAGQVLEEIDRDSNQSISRAEATAFIAAMQRDLSLRIDNQPLSLQLDKSKFGTPNELRSGSGFIQLTFSAAFNVDHSGAHQLKFDNRHLPGISAYLFNAIQPDSLQVKITGQRRNETQSSGEIDFVLE